MNLTLTLCDSAVIPKDTEKDALNLEISKGKLLNVTNENMKFSCPAFDKIFETHFRNSSDQCKLKNHFNEFNLNAPLGEKITECLFRAIQEGNIPKVRKLLSVKEKRSDVNKKGSSLYSALISLESERKRKCILKMLVESGVDYTVKEEPHLRDAFLNICHSSLEGEALYFLNLTGNDVQLQHHDIPYMRSALHYAVKNSNYRLISRLLELHVKFCIPLDQQDIDGLSPYLWAIKLGQNNIVKMMEKTGLVSTLQRDCILFLSTTEWEQKGAEDRRLHYLKQMKKLIHQDKLLGKTGLCRQKDYEEMLNKFNKDNMKTLKFDDDGDEKKFNGSVMQVEENISMLPPIHLDYPDGVVQPPSHPKSIETHLPLVNVLAFCGINQTKKKIEKREQKRQKDNRVKKMSNCVQLEKMFTIKADQCTPSFRKSMMKKNSKEENVPLPVRDNLNSFAIIFGKDKRNAQKRVTKIQGQKKINKGKSHNHSRK